MNEISVYSMGLPMNPQQTWKANPDLGELYPDAAFPGSTGWIATGNLAASTTPTSGYYREISTTTATPPGGIPWGFPFKIMKNLGAAGSPSFISATQSGSSLGSCWYEDLLNAANGWTGDTAAITSTGTLISNTFNYTMPSQLNATGPYLLCATGYQPQQWYNPIYSAQWLTSTLVSQNFVDTQSGDSGATASGLIMLNDSSSPPHTAYLMLNGMGDQQFFGADTMSQMALSTMLYSFMEAGISTYLSTPATGAIHQVPLVSISTPAATQQFINPSSVLIGWGISWQRWGGTAYTNDYSATFSDPSITMEYNVKYSPGGGL